MGIEYPVLAFIAGLMFISIVLSALFLYLYVVGELSRVPFVSGSGDIRVIFDSAVVRIRVVHERGEPVKLERMLLATDTGVIEYTFPERRYNAVVEEISITVTLVGFEENTLLPGSTGLVLINITSTQQLFKEGKAYSAVLFFDKGTLAISLTVVYIVR